MDALHINAPTPQVGEDIEDPALKTVETAEVEPNERILRWFDTRRLPDSMACMMEPFGELATHIAHVMHPSAERTVALRKLLESRDAAVRACLE